MSARQRPVDRALHRHLENVECFVLDHLSVVLELPHDELQVVTRLDIASHDVVELAVK